MVQEAKKHDIPVLAVCGKLDLNPSEIKDIGLYEASEIYDATKAAAYSYENAAALISVITKELLTKLQADLPRE